MKNISLLCFTEAKTERLNFPYWHSQISLWVSFLHRPAWKGPDVQLRDRQPLASLKQAAHDSDKLHLWWEEQFQKEEFPSLLKWNLMVKGSEKIFHLHLPLSQLSSAWLVNIYPYKKKKIFILFILLPGYYLDIKD